MYKLVVEDHLYKGLKHMNDFLFFSLRLPAGLSNYLLIQNMVLRAKWMRCGAQARGQSLQILFLFIDFIAKAPND